MSQYEEAVVAAMFLEPAFAIPHARRILETRDFTDETCRKMYGTLCDMFDQGVPIDFLTFHHELEMEGIDISVSRISGLSDYVTTAHNIQVHAGFVRDIALRRRMATSFELASRVVEDDMSILDNISEAIVEAQTERRSDVPFKDLVFSSVDRLETAQHGMVGLDTGFPTLDDMSGGLREGHLIILAGRPASGKTSLMLDMVRHISQKHPVGIFSIEMVRDEIVQRLISAQSRIDFHQMRRHNLSGDQWGAISRSVVELQDRRIWIDDFGAPKIGPLCAAAKLWKSVHGIKAVFVDYLQLIHGEGESQQLRITDVAQKLKALAKAICVPVVALSQLNREVEHRPDGKPQLADLRESGSIEQAADLALLIWRPGMYKEGDPTETKILVRKQRGGPEGDIDLIFDREYTSFREAKPWCG
ncbi:MAG: replicative DNA helicase [Pseudomonadota bacterium]